MASSYAGFHSRRADLTVRAAVWLPARAMGAALLAFAVATPPGSAEAVGTLTAGMTAGDLPVTTGNPDQGFEGYRFVGYNLHDALVLWDLSGAGDQAADIKPGLATEWHVDEGDSKRWRSEERRVGKGERAR